MHRIFAGLAIIASIFLIGEATLGFVLSYNPALFKYHILAGEVIVTFICLTHVTAMLYFIGNGKKIKKNARLLGGEPQVIKEVGQFKMWIFSGAALAIVFIVSVAVAGEEVLAGRIPTYMHTTMAIIAIALNFFSFRIEYKILKKNLELIDLLVKRYDELMQKEDVPENK